MEIDLKNILSLSCDVLIIGSGGAALRAAIEAKKKDMDVVLVSKSRLGYGNNTAMAGSAISVATGSREPRDSVEIHFQDTIKGGRFVNDQKMVEITVQKGIEEIDNLQKYGVSFRRRNDGVSVLWAPGHTYPRSIITTNGIGTDFTIPLYEHAKEMGCRLLDKILITRLLMKEGTVVGALGLGENGEIRVFYAKATILATGGFSHIFARTDNAVGTTGDGIILAYEAGASLSDMEFTQFYPVSLGEWGARGVIYELLVAAEGAILRNAQGEDILEKYGVKDFVAKTRDVVARAVAKEIWCGRSVGGFVTLDFSSFTDEKMKRLVNSLPKGVSEENRTILVAPNAHFTCGGIKTDTRTGTGIDGLLAAGEVCAGVNGANRITGNALTEIFVFGAIAGQEAAAHAKSSKAIIPQSADLSQGIQELKRISSMRGTEELQEISSNLKQVMWNKSGPVRNEQGLKQALEKINSLRGQFDHASVTNPKEATQALRLHRMLTVSEIVTRAAIQRTESRGVHYRTDWTEVNNKDWLRNIIVHKQGEGMTLNVVPTQLSILSP